MSKSYELGEMCDLVLILFSSQWGEYCGVCPFIIPRFSHGARMAIAPRSVKQAFHVGCQVMLDPSTNQIFGLFFCVGVFLFGLTIEGLEDVFDFFEVSSNHRVCPKQTSRPSAVLVGWFQPRFVGHQEREVVHQKRENRRFWMVLAC